MGTAIEEWVVIAIGYGNYLWIKKCRCWQAIKDTGGVLYCPAHGYVK